MTASASCAGFKGGASKIALGSMRGAFPAVTFLATGFRLDAQSCRKATKEMEASYSVATTTSKMS